MRSRSWSSGARVAIALALFACAPAAADTVLSRISIRHRHLPDRFYGEVHRFPASVRDYSTATLFGWSFREELPSGAVRELGVSRLRSSGAYLIATDLFANGRFSTMSHTVLMVFPRNGDGEELYRIVPQASGDVHLLAPDGSILLVDGATGRVKPSRDFHLAPLGAPGTPPGLRHRGFHLEIHSVGRSPFLRGTPVVVTNGSGSSCRLLTDDVFVYGDGPESDVFAFATDAAFHAFLDARCPTLSERAHVQEASAPGFMMPPALPAADAEPVPILVPVSASASRAHVRTYVRRKWPSRTGGLLWQLFSP
ncbi:MAG: hypothetical protein ACREQ9_21950 [Candidatus Binatia bacterium]